MGRKEKDRFELKDDKEHFLFSNKKKVRFWFLSDIFKIGFFKGMLKISIGDILIILAVICAILKW